MNELACCRLMVGRKDPVRSSDPPRSGNASLQQNAAPSAAHTHTHMLTKRPTFCFTCTHKPRPSPQLVMVSQTERVREWEHLVWIRPTDERRNRFKKKSEEERKWWEKSIYVKSQATNEDLSCFGHKFFSNPPNVPLILIPPLFQPIFLSS